MTVGVETAGLNPMSFADHLAPTMERLKYQRETGRFCDVLITVNGRRFTAHRNILASCSPYFDSIFRHTKVVRENVTMNSIQTDVFELFLNYIYSGNIVIDKLSVNELLKLANNLLIPKLKSYCSEYLDRYLDATNVLSIKQMAEKYGMIALMKTATEFFDANINRCLLESVDIVQYSYSQFTKLLAEPKYAGLIQPDAHLKVIVRWISDDVEKRQAYFRTLLGTLQLTSVSESTMDFLLDFASLFINSTTSRVLFMQQLSRAGMLTEKYQDEYAHLLSTTAIPEDHAPQAVENNQDLDELDDEEGFSDLEDEDGSLYGSDADSGDGMDAEYGAPRTRKRRHEGSSGSEGETAKRALLHTIKKQKGLKRRGRPPKRITDDDVDIAAFDEDELDGVYADAMFLTGTTTYAEDDILDPDMVEDGEEVSDPSGSNPCNYCRFASNSEEETARHTARKHNRNTIFVCQLCDFECKWSKRFYEHVRMHHFNAPPYNCMHCQYISSDRVQDLLGHMLTHTDVRFFKCATCGFRGRTRTQVWAHEKMHTDETTLHCIECGRSFNQQSALDTHMATHSDVRPHVCDECGFASKSPDDILAHKKGHNGDIFYCHIEGCDYSSPKKSQLAAHLRTHLAVRAHMCKICNRGFIEKSHLVRHERIHLQEKPFKCDICDYASSRRDKLKEHILKHHNSAQTNRAQRRKYKRERQLAALAAQEAEEAKLVGGSENVFRPINHSDVVEQWQSAHGHHFQQQGQFSPLGRSTSVCVDFSSNNFNSQMVSRSPHNHSVNMDFGPSTSSDMGNRAMSVPPYSQYQLNPQEHVYAPGEGPSQFAQQAFQQQQQQQQQDQQQQQQQQQWW
ncbi:unnamed protein product, partial [Mesorhabditis spiculigera]